MLKRIDILSFVYVSLVCLGVTIFRARVDGWAFYWLIGGVYLAVVALLARWHERRPDNRWIRFFRENYPLLSLTFFYESIPRYVTMVHGRFLEVDINAFERSLFGTYPNLALEAIVSRPVTEFFMLAYFSYYFYTVLPTLFLFFKQRYADLERYVFNLSLTFYVCYIGFVLLPVKGPIHALARAFSIQKLQGYVFEPLQTFLMNTSDPIGTCFPSSHVAVAWVALLSLGQLFGKKFFWTLCPFTVSLTAAVVYNRYHYLSDAVAGLITAGLCFALANALYAWRRHRVPASVAKAAAGPVAPRPLGRPQPVLPGLHHRHPRRLRRAH